MESSMIKGVLFDMDGTVFDTEQIYFRGWKWVSKVLGYDIPDSLMDRMRGSSIPTAEKIFNDYFEGRHEYMEARTRRQDFLDEEFRKHGVPLKPGAMELLHFLKEQGYRTALATSTFRKTAEFYLEKSGTKECFDVIIAGDMVKNGKPDPEIFLTAAEKLGLSAAECAVCEDSLNGVMAGRSSGAKVFYIPDLNKLTEEQLSLYVDRSFKNLLEVREYLESFS